MSLFVQIHPSEGTAFEQHFEGLADSLGTLPGMYFEMDGSFVWVDHAALPPSQMDGMVYDHFGRLAYVEVKGNCSRRQWSTLCNSICTPRPSPSASLPQPSEIGTAEDWDRYIRVHDVQSGEWKSAKQIWDRECSLSES